MGRALGATLMALVCTATPAAATQTTQTFRYGPIQIAPYGVDERDYVYGIPSPQVDGYLTGGTARLRGFAGLVEQRVSGYLLLQPDGSVDSVLDGLPIVSATRASVAFDSGARSVLLTPRRCGRYVLGAHFVSHSGETVDEDAPVEIGGCDTSPRIEAADVSPARLTGGRRRVRVSWRLAEPGSATVVEVQRIVPAGRFVRWRRELEMRASATAGANQLALALRRHGRPLAPSHYQIVLTTLSARGDPVDVSRLPLTVAG